MKQNKAINNNVGGFDLLTERDSGNRVRILTGSRKYSLEYWEELKNICDAVIDTIEADETDIIDDIEPHEPTIKKDREARKKAQQGILKH